MSDSIDARAASTEHGLYPASAFVVTTGNGKAGATTRQVRWYFSKETIALPVDAAALPQPVRGLTARDDLSKWLKSAAAGNPSPTLPPLVWTAAPDLIADARIDASAQVLSTPDHAWALQLAPRSPLIRDFFDAASAQWFAPRTLRARATVDGATATVRTLWPQEFRIDADTLRGPSARVPLSADAVRGLVRRDLHGGASSPFEGKQVWSRSDRARSHGPGQPILGFILDGAQGDDDEAHGGHFAVVTGCMREDGSIADWLVNNFYSLDIVSEKSIIAAPVPLDNYLGDLNSGQCWYRPSVMLVALLAHERAATLVQEAFNRTYVQFYRHAIVYDHAAMNCAGISVDVMRALGLDVRSRGASAPLAATLGLPGLMLRERSWRKGCALYDYLTEDLTRLLPAVAFEEMVAAITRCAAGEPMPRVPGPLHDWLAQDIERLLFLRFPQFPTARPPGDVPIVNPREYRERWPKDPAQARIFPVPSRPFPAGLRESDLPTAPRRRSQFAVAGWAAATAALTAAVLNALLR